jgi:hypothetical protein
MGKVLVLTNFICVYFQYFLKGTNTTPVVIMCTQTLNCGDNYSSSLCFEPDSFG